MRSKIRCLAVIAFVGLETFGCGSSNTPGSSLSTGGNSTTTASNTTVAGGATSTSEAIGGASSGGATPAGGASSGDGTTAGGAASSGGTAALGTAGSSASCPFPTTFQWKDWGGPLAEPKNGWVSLKDFSSVVYNGKHIVYSSTHDDSAYGAQLMVFNDWPDAATAVQTKLSTGAVAPTIFYFTPKKQWILGYQWCAARF
ncbi:MAG TPA: non-reducing end alpha-L-arabinofuranosidase family hydrolase, partial [Polyangiaceae bacterium]